MKVNLNFVPPGGGETDYEIETDMPAAPYPGDYVLVQDDKNVGTCDFIVRRCWWHIDRESKFLGIVAECEFAFGNESSESHKKSCEIYKAQGKPPQSLDSSVY